MAGCYTAGEDRKSLGSVQAGGRWGLAWAGSEAEPEA